MLNPITVAKKGERLYYKIKPELEKKYQKDYYVLINITTGKYIVGKTAVDVLEKAKKEFPDRNNFVAQVGRVTSLML